MPSLASKLGRRIANITDEQFEIAFDVWLQDYRVMSWADLTSDEIMALCQFHRDNFLKELSQYTKKKGKQMGTKLRRKKRTRKEKVLESRGKTPHRLRDELNRMAVKKGVKQNA